MTKEIFILRPPTEFWVYGGKQKAQLAQQTLLSIQGNRVKAEQRILLPKHGASPAFDIISVELEEAYAAAAFGSCKALQTQGYGPCDFALHTPLALIAGMDNLFVTAEIIRDFSNEMEITLRFVAEHTEIVTSVLSGKSARVEKHAGLNLKYMGQIRLSVDYRGRVYSSRGELLIEVTLDEVITEIKTALNTGRAASVRKNNIFPKPYQRSSIKMYEDVLAELTTIVELEKPVATETFKNKW